MTASRRAPRRLTLVPFFPDGKVGVIRTRAGGHELPQGEVGPDEHDLPDAALRILLETAGFRRQTFYEFARDGENVFGWCEGDEYHGRRPHRRVPLDVDEPDALVRRLRSSGAATLCDIVDAATRSYATVDRDAFVETQRAWLERAYLESPTPEGGSGFGGTPDEWRTAREPLVDAIAHDGTFLDLGCANGLLMESVHHWCAERGLAVEPFGVDISAGLIARARERLPYWADRMWVGDAATWAHARGQRFGYVHTLLDSVPAARRGALVRHVLDSVVAPGGRLIVSNYTRGTAHDCTAAQVLGALGYDVAGEARAPGGDRHTPPQSAWIDAPAL